MQHAVDDDLGAGVGNQTQQSGEGGGEQDEHEHAAMAGEHFPELAEQLEEGAGARLVLARVAVVMRRAMDDGVAVGGVAFEATLPGGSSVFEITQPAGAKR